MSPSMRYSMKSSTQKGNAHEIEVKKHHEAQGWKVFRVHKKAIWIDGKMILIGADAFGADLICKREGAKPKWIQVGADGAKTKKEAQLLEHPWNLEHEEAEVWLRIEGKKEYKVYRLMAIPVDGAGPRHEFVQGVNEKIRVAAAEA